ncbi:TIP120-domain-containing protein [Peniophora sp. CONT]|nr:TIP120-domain-containing protein [Peniophora sp. CONT]
MTKTYVMNQLIEKMQSPDQDFRYMGLSDLMKEVSQDPQSFLGDETSEIKVLNQVLKLVEDKISEVKNQAVKCLGQLIKIIRETHMEIVVDKLIAFFSSKEDELRDISGLALKTITSELPPNGTLAPKACAKLTPQLLLHLSKPETPPETLIETLSILTILISDFPAYVTALSLNPPPLVVIAPLLSHARPAVRKRATQTLAQFVPLSSQELFDGLLASDIRPNLAPSASLERQRTVVNLLAAIARVSPQRVAPALPEVVPAILKALTRDDDELRESSLQALEAITLKCPTEVTPFLSSIIQAANQYIKHDPNYAGGDDDEDEEMADEEEDEDEDLDQYSDDEDTSYKIRRSATKLQTAIIATRPELLVTLYKDVSPVLISRFGDREETVRLEVWATYVALLNQTRVYGGNSQVKDGVGFKRKRTPDGMDVEETGLSMLQSQVPSLSKALLNQMKSPRTPATVLQAGFGVLRTLLEVLPGSLSNQTALIISISKSVLSQSPSTASSTLHLSCLPFLTLFFGTHPPPVYSSALPNISPILLSTAAERHPRVASESFRVWSALLNAMKPVKGQDWVERIYDEALKRLSNHDTDAEVRMRAEEIIGDLWVCATDVVKAKGGKEWQFICRTTGKVDGAIKVVSRVAQEADVESEWVQSCVEWSMTMLRKAGRIGKVELFECLSVLLSRYDSVPAHIAPTLIPDLKTYLSISDIALLSQALSLIALMLRISPATTFPEVERDALADICKVAHSPLLVGAGLESMLAFMAALVEADGQISTHIVPTLVISAEKASSGDVSQANVAKCVAQIVKSAPAVTAGITAEFSKHVKASAKATSSQVVLSLLVLGEIGRFVDMTPNRDLFNQAIELFGSDQEDVRVAAAFAAGNITIGNLHQFLPALVKLVQGDAQKRLLALQALKEVATHTSTGQLENYAEALWVPLFESSEGADESAQNVAAACIGKLITTNASRYLPQVHSRLSDENAATRVTVLAAMRYTFADSSPSYDEILAPHILDFLTLMSDPALPVRRAALSAFNACAKAKPHLIREHLPTLLPKLYGETTLKPELIRTVQMGPWQHKVDDGLDARKTAYETLYTLLDTCLAKLDLNEYLKHVLVGLADPSDEIKVISHMMLFRLSQIAPTAVVQHLAEAAPMLEASMKDATINKDTVKQDLERAAEIQRSTLRAIAALSKITPPGAAPKFEGLVTEVKKSPQWGAEFNELAGH